MVTVCVGDRSQQWILNRDFISNRISSLRTKLDMFGDGPHEILLKKVEPPIFALALDWFLTGRLQCSKSHDTPTAPTKDHFARWCALYVFANQCELPRLCTAALDRIKQCLTNLPWKPTSTEVRYIFKETPHNSELRAIVVSEAAKVFIGQAVHDFKEHSDEWAELLGCHIEFHSKILQLFKAQFHTANDQRPKPRNNRKALRSHGQLLPGKRRTRPCSNTVIDLTADEDYFSH